MMDEAAPKRSAGAPLRMFLVFMTFWVVGRTVWNLSAPVPEPERGNPRLAGEVKAIDSASNTITSLSADRSGDLSRSSSADMSVTQVQSAKTAGRKLAGEPRASRFTATAPFLDARAVPINMEQESRSRMPAQRPATHNREDSAEPSILSRPVSEEVATSHRFTGYAWILLRQGSSRSLSAVPVLPGGLSGGQYGASQAGIQFAYRITGSDQRHIAGTLRASTALENGGDEELAIGGRIRPIAHLPLAIHAEQRFDPKSADLRGTAIFFAGGTGPHPLPDGLAVESWGQGGYLFGRGETWFFDGSVALSREIARSKSTVMTVGPGLWAGGQKGATRFDAGPRASLLAPLGDGHARLDFDWRQRVAGNARPGSGLTLTLSTGF